MLLIIDNKGNVIQNYGTNSVFPDGNIPNLPELPQGQTYVRINDKSDVAKQIMNAHEYTIDINNSKVNVTKTKAQWKSEQPIVKTKEEIAKEELVKAKSIEEKLDAIIKYLGLEG